MGRKRKFESGQRVHIISEGFEGIVVDYHQDRDDRGRYRVQRLYNNVAFGPAIWKETWDLQGTSGTNRRQVSIYTKNMAIGDRGCKCGCCNHIKKALGEINWDGSFKDDDAVS